jgi:hypothetical protein
VIVNSDELEEALRTRKPGEDLVIREMVVADLYEVARWFDVPPHLLIEARRREGKY